MSDVVSVQCDTINSQTLQLNDVKDNIKTLKQCISNLQSYLGKSEDLLEDIESMTNILRDPSKVKDRHINMAQELHSLVPQLQELESRAKFIYNRTSSAVPWEDLIDLD